MLIGRLVTPLSASVTTSGNVPSAETTKSNVADPRIVPYCVVDTGVVVPLNDTDAADAESGSLIVTVRLDGYEGGRSLAEIEAASITGGALTTIEPVVNDDWPVGPTALQLHPSAPPRLSTFDTVGT